MKNDIDDIDNVDDVDDINGIVDFDKDDGNGYYYCHYFDDDDDDPKRTFIFPSGRALKEARPCPQGDAQKSVALQLGECMAMMHSRSHRWWGPWPHNGVLWYPLVI